jgi:hypothetical protein
VRLAEVSAGSDPEKGKKKETWRSVDRNLRNVADRGRLRRRRRFQTRKPWLLFLALSRYLTRIASPGPMLWPSSRLSICELQPRQSTRRTNMGPNHRHATEIQELASLRLQPPDDFFPEACTKRCNEYSTFKPGQVTTKRREGDEHTLRGLAGVYQFRINLTAVSSNYHHTKTYNQTLLL